MDVIVRHPLVSTAPTNSGKMRLNVGWVNVILRLITSGSATEGNGNISDFFLVRYVHQHGIRRSLLLRFSVRNPVQLSWPKSTGKSAKVELRQFSESAVKWFAYQKYSRIGSDVVHPTVVLRRKPVVNEMIGERQR